MTGLATHALPWFWRISRAGPARLWPSAVALFALVVMLAGSGWAAGPPAAPVPAVPYYLAEGGETRGPVSLEVVIAEIGDGRVLPWTLVWKPGLSAWIRAGDLPELAKALAGATPRPPPPPAQPPPPPADLPADAVYFVAEGDVPRGPLSEAEVLAAIAAGEIGRATLLWQPGTEAWVRADTVAAFAGRFTFDPPGIPAAERMRQMMIGAWAFTPLAGDGGGVRTRLTFAGDMTVAGEVSVAVPGDAPVVRPISGEWAVEDASAERFTLLLRLTGGAPGRVVLRVVDPDTLVNETDGGSARRLRE